MKKLVAIFLSLLVVISLTSCGGKNTSSKDTESNKPTQTVTIGLMPDMDSVPFVIADQKGFFKEHGVDVKIEHFKSAKDRDSALQAGKLDGIVTDLLAVAFANDSGLSVKITSASVGDYKLVAGKNSGVTSVEQLSGKSIAVSMNTLIEYSTDKILEGSNMSPDSIKKVSIPQIPTRLEMLRSGKIDAATLPDPLATVAVKDGATLINSTKKIGINPGVIAFTQKSIDTKSTEIKALYAAYNEAVEFLQKEKPESYMDLIIKECSFPEVVKDSLEIPAYTKAQMPEDKDINSVIDWLMKKQLIKKTYTPQDLSNSSFIQ